MIKRSFDIPTIAMVLCIIVSGASLFIIFRYGYDDTFLSNLFYMLSAYTLGVVCYKISKLKKFIFLRLGERRIFSDSAYRRRYTLIASSIVTGSYIILKSVVGILFGIPWLIELALYYLLMFSLRILLLLNTSKRIWVEFLTASILLFIAASIAFLTVDLVRGNYRFHYPEFLIYAFALYSFVLLFTAVSAFIRNRKTDDRNLRCYLSVTLSSAFVSMIVLQSAMFSSFGGPEDLVFERAMYASFSFVVVILIAILSISLFAEGIKENIS